MTETLELGSIQGFVVRGYRLPSAGYLFLRIDEPARARALLAEVTPDVLTADPWERKPESGINVAFTYAGLAAIGVPGTSLAGFPEEFATGMAARAAVLGDVGESAPEHWEAPFGPAGQVHVLVMISAQDPAALAARDAMLREAIERHGGITVVGYQAGSALPGGVEHFGYADGFAQPALDGNDDGTNRHVGGGVPEADGGWRPLAPGEFILGYEDEDTRVDPERGLPSAPADPFGRSGTYMVWRKLYQDVALFRHVLREAAELYGGGNHEKLAAKVVGRWPNGTPLVASPDAPIADFDPKSDPRTNGFRYAAEDPDGRRCPIGAHIRRSNPRDSLGFDGLLSFRHRIIRRGMPYGPPLPADAIEDDHVDRGLIFVCFNASISRQFEGIQAQWLNDGNVFHLGHDSDFLMGDPHGTGKMTVEGDPPFLLGPQGPFVTTRGGAYLFVPGMRALAALAG
jgi:Dyp-type peroxidase family